MNVPADSPLTRTWPWRFRNRSVLEL
jgi:hypothetical protein